MREFVVLVLADVSLGSVEAEMGGPVACPREIWLPSDVYCF